MLHLNRADKTLLLPPMQHWTAEAMHGMPMITKAWAQDGVAWDLYSSHLSP